MTVLADVGIGPISIPTPGDVVTALKNVVVDVADAVFDKIIEWIAGLLADAVAKVTEALVTLLAVVKPSISPGGQIESAAPIQQSVLGLAASLVVLFYMFRLIHGLITGQAGQNLRATLIDLPMVIVGTLFFGFLCYLLLRIVDEFSEPMINDYASQLNTTVGELYSKDGIVQGGVFVIIFALLYIVGAVFLCFELFVRSSLIYLVIMFAPLAIATRIWGPTRSYARRATETAVALIFSKLAIAVTFATGASLMNGAAETGGNVGMIQGSAILLLAAFMPFALMRVIPMMEGAVAGEGVARSMGIKAAGGSVVAAGVGQAAFKPISSTTSRMSGSRNGGASTGGTSGSSEGHAGSPQDGSPPGGPTGGGGSGPNPSPASKSPGTSDSKGQGSSQSSGTAAPEATTNATGRSARSLSAETSQPRTSDSKAPESIATPPTRAAVTSIGDTPAAKPSPASTGAPTPGKAASLDDKRNSNAGHDTPTLSPTPTQPTTTTNNTGSRQSRVSLTRPSNSAATEVSTPAKASSVKPPVVQRPTLNRRPEGGEQ